MLCTRFLKRAGKKYNLKITEKHIEKAHGVKGNYTMKRIVGNVLLYVLSLIAAIIFGFLYIKVFKFSLVVIAAFFVFLAVYASFIAFGWKSMQKLNAYEQRLIHFGLNKEDESKVLFYSLSALSPMWLCIFLVSCIPLFTNGVWMVTIFPCIFLSCMPAATVLEEYYGLTRKKLPFVLLSVLFAVICCLLGIAVSNLVFN